MLEAKMTDELENLAGLIIYDSANDSCHLICGYKRWEVTESSGALAGVDVYFIPAVQIGLRLIKKSETLRTSFHWINDVINRQGSVGMRWRLLLHHGKKNHAAR